MFIAAIDDENWSGAVNTVAPGCVTMKEIAVAIGRELRKPAALKVPSWALKLLLGEFADALLVSQRVSAERAQTLGYTFEFPDITSALRNLMH
jgi:NAD dependent epimerase/dehydratase family enzyme